MGIIREFSKNKKSINFVSCVKGWVRGEGQTRRWCVKQIKEERNQN
jgi:hypothetical protein